MKISCRICPSYLTEMSQIASELQYSKCRKHLCKQLNANALDPVCFLPRKNLFWSLVISEVSPAFVFLRLLGSGCV